jgi:hypothetical protein
MIKTFSQLFRIALATFLLAACNAAPAPATTTVPPAPTAPTLPTYTPLPTDTPGPVAGRVLIISVDGLRPDAIALAPMPNLNMLMQSGAYSLTAQTVFPSATLPAHASMLTGLCPAEHGVDWNDYIPENGFAQGPSLFALAKEAGLHTVMVVAKEKMRQLTPPETTDVFEFINDRDVVLADAAGPILKAGFDLAFIHLATTDDMGHVYGWLSPEQLSVARRADEAIGTMLSALDEAGLRQDTLIIITADHGGHEKLHGSRSAEDMTVPWIINGPGIAPQIITLPINTTDTAATAAWALNLSAPQTWVGRPILEAFGEEAPLRADPRCP